MEAQDQDVQCVLFTPYPSDNFLINTFLFPLVGPALEAFGFQRIIYGSSPSPLSHASSHAGDWYELARESFAELGVEQEGIDAVFFGNVQRALSNSS